MTFSAEGLRRFLDTAAFPLVVYAEKDDTPVLNADRKVLAGLIEARAVVGHGSRSKLRRVRMCAAAPRGPRYPGLATPNELRRVPCCGDVAKAFTIADGPYRQWKNNPPPRPAPMQNARNNGN